MRAALTVFPAALALSATAACGATTAAAPGGLTVPAAAQSATVERVVDGDTVVLRGTGTGPLSGRSTKVRLLEIDAPEVSGQPECFGSEATERVEELLPRGARVRVEADRELQDQYGRTLLYVWTDSGASVQEVLVREGAVRTVLFRPNDRYIRDLRAVEDQARTARRGLWGACPDERRRR